MITGLDERIKRLRIKKGISIGELGSLIGIDPNNILAYENGSMLPDITMLIELSDALGASIDYILRGKEYRDNKAIGRLELCCRNDSVEELNKINRDVISFIDVDGNDIFYYIDKYDSESIFSEILNKYGLKLLTDLNNKEIDHLAIYSLLVKFDYLDSLEALGFFKDSSLDPLAGFSKKNINIYSDGLFEIVMRQIKFNGKIFNKIFTLHENDYINPVGSYQRLYSDAIAYAYRYERNEIGAYLSRLFIEINNKSLSLYNTNHSSIYSSKYNLTISSLNYYDRDSINYAVIVVSSDSIKELLLHLSLNEALELYKLNERYNMNLVPSGLFDEARLKLDGEDNKNKLFVASCMDNGLISIDKLIKCNNYYLIKNALYDNPISPVELKDRVIVSTINDSYLVKNGRSIPPNEARKALLASLYPKLVNKGNEIMTEEYFLSLLQDNDIDTLVIKLSVRLEALLKSVYRLDGTFEEMINEYSIDNNLDEAIEELFHKLRKQRNSAVHADRFGMRLTNEELRRLIELITKMGK